MADRRPANQPENQPGNQAPTNPNTPQEIARIPNGGGNVSVGDYKQCIEDCKSLTSSKEREICMEGCRFISSGIGATGQTLA
jgi:hypothetical protein